MHFRARFIKRLIANRLVQHLGFWIFMFLLLARLFAEANWFDDVNLAYTSLFTFTLFAMVEWNSLILFRMFLDKSRWTIWLISVLLFIGVGVWFNNFFFSHLVDYIFPQYFFISYYSIAELSLFYIVLFVLHTFLHITRGWIKEQRLQSLQLTLAHEKTRAELKALRNQIDPHFLFNSLNVIYNLSEKKSDDTGNAIIKLSDLLRYVTYQSGNDWISAEEELLHLQQYIELQKMRYNAYVQVEIADELEQHDISIPAMILFPIVENCFKHGIAMKERQPFIQIRISATANTFTFSCTNTCLEENNSSPGVGLQNISKRLDLIFQENWEWKISNDKGIFSVELKMPVVRKGQETTMSL